MSSAVNEIWRLSNILRDDGVSYHRWIVELSYLLFLKMAKETGVERLLPQYSRWDDLLEESPENCLESYKQQLNQLGRAYFFPIQSIFRKAETTIKRPDNLRLLLEGLERFDWFSLQKESLGDLYEGLLEKSGKEIRSNAGQYFTPRPLVQMMVRLVDPKPGESIQDPAAGTGGFLIGANEHIKRGKEESLGLLEQLSLFGRSLPFMGIELIEDTHRLGAMNMLLHGIECDFIDGDALSTDAAELPKVDVILSNPPFGGSKNIPESWRIPFPTTSKQFLFLQYIYSGLQDGGRAAVVLPDDVLFREGVGGSIRADLMDKCDLHAVVRLPLGIFHARSVRTNVLFFTYTGGTNSTRKVWFCDLRTGIGRFGKRNVFGRKDLEIFERNFSCFDDFEKDWEDLSEPDERIRCFSRKEIRDRGDDLNIFWLKEEEPEMEIEEIADDLLSLLSEAYREMEQLSEKLIGWKGSADG